MWWWTLLGWSAVSLGLAAVFHRLAQSHGRFPPEVLAFLGRLENVLQQRHPAVRYGGLLLDRFACLLEVDGQETPVSLHGVYRQAQAFPAAFEQIVDQLVREVRSGGLDQATDLEFAAAVGRLLPQIRSRDWLSAKGCFGDAGLVFRALGEDLVVVYVLDDPECMVFVCQAHLRHWRQTAETVHQLALRNLAATSSAALPALQPGEPAQRLQSGDGYDAARVLLLEQTAGLLVAMPDRDTLWVGDAGKQDLAQLMATTAAIAEQSAHPVSPRVFRLKDGQLEAVRGTD